MTEGRIEAYGIKSLPNDYHPMPLSAIAWDGMRTTGINARRLVRPGKPLLGLERHRAVRRAPCCTKVKFFFHSQASSDVIAESFPQIRPSNSSLQGSVCVSMIACHGRRAESER